MNREEYKGVYVYAQQVDNKVSNIALELLGKAKALADDLGSEVVAMLLGSDIKDQAQILAEYGADKVIVVDHPFLKEYMTEPYTQAISAIIREFKPDVVLFGATAIGRDLAPCVAATVHTGLTADCTKLDSGDFPMTPIPGKETLHKQLLMTRPAFGGNTIATTSMGKHNNKKIDFMLLLACCVWIPTYFISLLGFEVIRFCGFKVKYKMIDVRD